MSTSRDPRAPRKSNLHPLDWVTVSVATTRRLCVPVDECVGECGCVGVCGCVCVCVRAGVGGRANPH